MLFIIAAALLALIWIVNKLQASGTIVIPEFFQKLLGTIGGVDEIIRITQFTSVFISGHLKIQSTFALDHTGLLLTGKSAKIDAFANINSKLRRLVRFTKTPGYVVDLKRQIKQVISQKELLYFAQLTFMFISNIFNVFYFIADNYTSSFLFGIDIGKQNQLAADNFSNWVWIISSFFAVLSNLTEIYRMVVVTKAKKRDITQLIFVCLKNTVDTFMAACYIWPFLVTRKIVGLFGMIIGAINVSRMAAKKKQVTL